MGLTPRFALLADVLELQALGIERADQPVGPEGSRALAETCRQAVWDLQRLLSALPVDLLNWSDAAKRQGAGTHEPDANLSSGSRIVAVGVRGAVERAA